MANVQPISLKSHRDKRWKRYPNYGFAARDTIYPLSIHEVPRAVMGVAMGFIKRGSDFSLVAIQGLEPDRNLFVAADHHWRGQYVPEGYQYYPFSLGRTKEGKPVLCIDEDSGVVVPEGTADSEPFFDSTDSPNPVIEQLMGALTRYVEGGNTVARVCKTLDTLGLIEEWPLRLKTDAGEQAIRGFYCINEKALSQLPAEQFLELRKSDALLVAYCQLLSKVHIQALARLYTDANEIAAELGVGAFDQGGSISFDSL